MKKKEETGEGVVLRVCAWEAESGGRRCKASVAEFAGWRQVMRKGGVKLMWRGKKRGNKGGGDDSVSGTEYVCGAPAWSSAGGVALVGIQWR